MKKFIALSLMLFAQQAQAGWIAESGTIVQLASSIGAQTDTPAGSTDRFAIKIAGSSITTCETLWIVFEKSYFGTNPEAYQRAFTVALTAYTTGTKVKVHNINADKCNGATSIQIVK